MRFFFKITLLFFITSFFACDKDTAADTSSVSSQRPENPWAFRSVLDLKPRMLTLALHDNFYVAYDTENASFYKAWKGYVNFDGAVYTTAHGPQPITIGDAYFINQHKNPWLIIQNGKEVIPDVKYRGHRFNHDHAELMYTLSWGEGKTVMVNEQPEYFSPNNQLAGLERIFTTTNVPDGTQVALRTNVNSVAVKEQIKTDGQFSIVNEENVTRGKYSGVAVDGRLILNSNGSTTFTVPFIKTPMVENENKTEEEENEGRPAGYKLIARSDCKSCHNTYRKTIGPSYVAIAEKYQTNDANITMLANKIKVGGSGVWGEQVMSAHDDTPDEDLRSMASYILSLDKNDKPEGAATASAESMDYVYGKSDLKEEQFYPGVITQFYTYNKNLKALADTKSGGKLVSSGIMPSIRMEQSDMKSVDNNLAVFINGYLLIREDGQYDFRLVSDDGSILYIDEKMIINHDGPHGADPKDGSIKLKAGYHPFRVDFFQGGGGKSLLLFYKPPGKKNFDIVPPELYGHLAADRPKATKKALPFLATNRIPGDGSSLNEVHPSFTLSQARPDYFTPKVGGMDFLPDGRLVVCTWEAAGPVYILDNVNGGDPSEIGVTQIASGLAEPLGLKVVDGDIYILQKQELTKLVDTDGDDMIDEYQTVSNNWRVSANFHEFAFGLVYKDGFFYGALATAINPGGASTQPQIQDRGKVIKISKADGSVEFVAHGLRTPNGIGLGMNDRIFVADNQGDWLPASKIVEIIEGNFYGSRSVNFEGTKNTKEAPPVVWLPQDEIGNSPSTPMGIEVGPYKGQLIHGEVTHGGVKRVFAEEVDGQLQGAVFRFIQGLEAGVNRMVWGPDKALYVGGVGNPGNWRHDGKLWYGLQRLEYNNESTFEMLAVRAKSNGVEIEFTEPLKAGDGWNKGDYKIQQWYYKPTNEYGGPKLDLKALPIKSVSVSENRKRVFLELGGMKPGHIVYVKLQKYFISDNNHELWSTEAWYNMNKIPKGLPGNIRKRPAEYAASQLNSLSPAEKAAGWELLFDGKTTNGWHTYGKDKTGASWQVKNGELVLNVVPKPEGGTMAKDGGDIVSEKAYDDFELSLEWNISNCGNSGLFFNAVESDKYHAGYMTGPEMQILDNTCHPDSKYKTHRAGDLYDMIETRYSTVRPAGEWNKVTVRSLNGAVEFWLNGKKVVDFEMFTDEWKEMIANSKFKDMSADFGTYKKGHIMLQDHGDQVRFRNIKIRPLQGEI